MKKACVIGNGISAKAARKLLEEKGYEVTQTDRVTDKNAYDFYVLSPGIDPRREDIAPLVNQNKIISEIELALRYTKCKLIGVTGTNGKSSLVMFLSKMLSAKPCGNIGIAACDVLPYLQEEDVAILELSSFQLEHTFAQKLDGAIILNISPAHMDRYESFEQYKMAKYRIKNLLKKSGQLFQEKNNTKRGFFPFSGPVYQIIEDVHAAFGGNISKAKKEFHRLEHRLEFVIKKDGVRYINDSKATNFLATKHAVNVVDGKIILLVGGQDRESDFSPLKDLDAKVKAVICFGQSKDQIKNVLHSNCFVYTVNKMEDAIEKGRQLSKQGDTILLSPGCASFDQYANFMQRGEAFKKEVCK